MIPSKCSIGNNVNTVNLGHNKHIRNNFYQSAVTKFLLVAYEPYKLFPSSYFIDPDNSNLAWRGFRWNTEWHTEGSRENLSTFTPVNCHHFKLEPPYELNIISIQQTGRLLACFSIPSCPFLLWFLLTPLWICSICHHRSPGKPPRSDL